MRHHFAMPSLLEARCVFSGHAGSDGTRSHVHEMWPGTGSVSSVCTASPPALCSGVLVAHRASGLASEAAPIRCTRRRNWQRAGRAAAELSQAQPAGQVFIATPPVICCAASGD